MRLFAGPIFPLIATRSPLISPMPAKAMLRGWVVSWLVPPVPVVVSSKAREAATKRVENISLLLDDSWGLRSRTNRSANEPGQLPGKR